MAKILLGATIGDIRGKQGGTVYSRNRYTNYTRQKTIPVNPRTALQTAKRNAFGSISSNWRTIGADAQQSWVNLADQVAATNIFGNAFKYTGFNVYMMGIQTLASNGLPYVVSAPAPSAPPTLPYLEGVEFSNVTAPAAALQMILSADAKSNADSFYLQLQATPTVAGSLSNSSVQNLYRNFFDGNDSAVGVNDLTAAYTAVFGVYDVPFQQCLYIRARFVDRASGLYGAWQVYRLDSGVTPP